MAPRFYRPFQVLEHIGSVAYKHALPVGTHLLDVLHVSLFKKFHRDPPRAPQLLCCLRLKMVVSCLPPPKFFVEAYVVVSSRS